MGGMRRSTIDEKTAHEHEERVIHSFSIDDEIINIVMTKHGHFRILENKNISLEEFGKRLVSIGKRELKDHFKKAKVFFPLDMRESVEWERKVDYTIAIYDMELKLVTILGIHPHLNRMTIVTMIPKIDNVYADVYGAYRIDSKKTVNTKMNYKLLNNVKMKEIRIF